MWVTKKQIKEALKITYPTLKAYLDQIPGLQLKKNSKRVPKTKLKLIQEHLDLPEDIFKDLKFNING